MYRIKKELDKLGAQGNRRYIPSGGSELIDFSTNDYLGIGEDVALRRSFMAQPEIERLSFTSSASRLLASHQNEYLALEALLAGLYGRPCLLFNSGYHANTGLISALADKDTLIVADKLVHASIIDGYKLGDAELARFRHNDINHLERILSAKAGSFSRVLIVVESVYSMDGDIAPLEDLAAIKRRYSNAMLYVDEAHAFGAMGERGLGLVADSPIAADVDILVGTFGKAAASQGAFAVMDECLKDYAINRARSFIFSTAIPPVNCAWTRFIVEKIPDMNGARKHLKLLSQRLYDSLKEDVGNSVATPTHILPVIIGDARRVVQISRDLLERGVKVLPIRTPTVPPHTERLRISLSAKMQFSDVDLLSAVLNSLL